MIRKAIIIILLASIYALYMGATAAAIAGMLAAVFIFIIKNTSEEKGNLWIDGPEKPKKTKNEDDTIEF